jgi:hypothetical protein
LSDDRKDSAIAIVRELETAALEAAALPDDPETQAQLEAAVRAAKAAGATDEEIREITAECASVMDDLMTTCEQLASIEIENVGIFQKPDRSLN